MEMQASTPEVSKKIWHIVRVIFFMLKKVTSKSRIMSDLHFMLKRGNKLAGKAIGNLFTYYHIHNYSSFSCRSNDALNYISPREYEFSCSNSPAVFNPFHHAHKRKHHFHYPKSYKYDDVTTVAAVQKMLEMLNNEVVEASPMVFPGFGKSPMVRQLKVTDSPFPLKDEGGDGQVDKAAEEFIKKFYRDLKLQKITSANSLESPYHGMWGR